MGLIAFAVRSRSWCCLAAGLPSRQGRVARCLSGVEVNHDIANWLWCRGMGVVVSGVLLGALEGEGEVLDVTRRWVGGVIGVDSVVLGGEFTDPVDQVPVDQLGDPVPNGWRPGLRMGCGRRAVCSARRGISPTRGRRRLEHNPACPKKPCGAERSGAAFYIPASPMRRGVIGGRLW
jgi:hypothetical protein